MGPVMRSLFRLRYLGVDRIPPRGPAILAANHLSMLDGVVLAYAPAWTRRRTIRFLVAAEFFDHRFTSFFLRRFSQIPISRGRQDFEALDQAIETIRAGALAGIFPEGRINERTDLQRGRTGVARIALTSGAPVIPVGIWGTQNRWPKTGPTLRRPLRTRVTVSFGDALQPVGDVESPEDVQSFTDLVMREIAKQVDEARSDVEWP